MLDLTKPVQTRAGVAATIVATGVLDAIPGVGAARFEGQTILARHSDDVRLHYHYPNGRFMDEDHEDSDDLINVPPEPVVTHRYFAVYRTSKPTIDVIGGIGPAVVELLEGDWRLTANLGIDVTFTDGKPTAVSLVQ